MILNFHKELIKISIFIFILQFLLSCSNDKDILITINHSDIMFKRYKIIKILDTGKTIYVYFTKGEKFKNIEIINAENNIIVKAEYADNFLIRKVNYLIQNSSIKDMIFYANTNINSIKIKSMRYIWKKYKNTFYFIEEIKPNINLKQKSKILLLRNIYTMTNKKFIESEMIYIENSITNVRYLNYKKHIALINRLKLNNISDIVTINKDYVFPSKIYKPKNKKYISNIIKLIYPLVSRIINKETQ